MPSPPVLSFAHDCVRDALSPGGVALDATAGNGHDTLALARGVQPNGRVFAFDIQQTALDATSRRLDAAGLIDTITLLEASHDTMADSLPSDVHGTVDAIMFNLGYLPGSDKTVITRPATTVPALHQALTLLRPGGVLTVVVYRGHDGGAEEARAVTEWAKRLDPSTVQVHSYRTLNRTAAPELLVIDRAPDAPPED